MGNFYVNYTIRSSDVDAVTNALAGRRAFVASVTGKPIIAFDEESDSQDPNVVKELGCHLSQVTHSPVLAVMNHDDDILMCGLFEAGECIDLYDSNPDYFESEGEPRGPIGGDAAKLCQAFDSPNQEVVENILRNNEYVFAVERHEALVKALGLPSYGVASGFSYISQGELPDGLTHDNLVEVA